jgi:hypothetical protein
MLLEIVDDDPHFQTITRSGQTVDHGVVRRRDADRPGGNPAVSGGTSPSPANTGKR